MVGSVQSVDVPGVTLTTANSCGANDKSVVPLTLTEQIPIVAPVRTRVVEFGRSGDGDSRDPATGQCTPDCPEVVLLPLDHQGQRPGRAFLERQPHLACLIPKPGEIEHWTYINGGGGWDHPIHLHFEEGITMNRGTGVHPGDREPGAQGCLAAAARPGRCSSRSSSASTAAPTSTTATTRCTRTSPC